MKTKTCPTCVGEGKVGNEIKDTGAEMTRRVIDLLPRIGKALGVVALIPITTVATTIFLRFTLWTINSTAAYYGDGRPTEVLAGAAIVGGIAGLIAAFAAAINTRWDR